MIIQRRRQNSPELTAPAKPRKSFTKNQFETLDLTYNFTEDEPGPSNWAGARRPEEEDSEEEPSDDDDLLGGKEGFAALADSEPEGGIDVEMESENAEADNEIDKVEKELQRVSVSPAKEKPEKKSE